MLRSKFYLNDLTFSENLVDIYITDYNRAYI